MNIAPEKFSRLRRDPPSSLIEPPHLPFTFTSFPAHAPKQFVKKSRGCAVPAWRRFSQQKHRELAFCAAGAIFFETEGDNMDFLTAKCISLPLYQPFQRIIIYARSSERVSPSTPTHQLLVPPLRGAYPFRALKELQGRFAALKCHSHAVSRRLSDPLRHPFPIP